MKTHVFFFASQLLFAMIIGFLIKEPEYTLLEYLEAVPSVVTIVSVAILLGLSNLVAALSGKQYGMLRLHAWLFIGVWLVYGLNLARLALSDGFIEWRFTSSDVAVALAICWCSVCSCLVSQPQKGRVVAA